MPDGEFTILKNIEPDVTIDEIEHTGQGFSALGPRPDSLDNLGKDLHEEVVVRCNNFFKKGLPKDQQEALIAKHKIPSNCKSLQPPQINADVQPCLIKLVLEHNRFISALQQQLGDGLSSLAEACQLFASVHHGLSVHRRFKIIPDLNPECKKEADTLKIYEFLFNTKFAEAMRNEHAIKKASVDFK
ncbi:unnamed protein product [Callosobruchus maculatus]|uniref:Uncharacterized protein n=1 Tax=Callosobruchus maculatus TaxID=64391 RepID=A0A653CXC5_CALMS|nr:unnamed protein product [Callosobruchus maculatus]